MSPELRKRIITAVILAPLVLALVFLANNLVFSLAMALIAMAAGFEWTGLAGIRGPFQWLYLGVLAASMGLLIVFPEFGQALLVIALALWIALTACVLGFPRGAEIWDRTTVLAGIGWVILLATYVALTELQQIHAGAWAVLGVLFVIWGADIGAYFAGRQFGKRRLAAAVSPGKTWEGVVGGVMLGTAALIALVTLTPLGTLLSPARALLMGVSLCLVSVVGDLVESMLKRRRGLKDSGNLLPGHGGLLDRIDSLLAVAPVAALWLLEGNTP